MTSSADKAGIGHRRAADMPDADASAGSTTARGKPAVPAAEERKLSRMERLKKKVRGLQGKNPDIYPMR